MTPRCLTESVSEREAPLRYHVLVHQRLEQEQTDSPKPIHQKFKSTEGVVLSVGILGGGGVQRVLKALLSKDMSSA